MLEPAPYREDFAPLALASRDLRRPALFVSCRAAGGGLRRYSIAAAEPIAELRADHPLGEIELTGQDQPGTNRRHMEFSAAVRSALEALSPLGAEVEARWPPAHRPFLGGLAGVLSYEFGARFERMPFAAAPEGAGRPCLWMGVYPAAYIADHERREGWWLCRDSRERGRGGFARQLDRIKAWVIEAPEAAPPRPDSGAAADDGLWTPSLDAARHRRAVERIQEWLRRGDAYQVNLAVGYRRATRARPERIFAELLSANPAPYAAYLRGDDWAAIGSSPELLLDLTRERQAATHPIKGTIRRSVDAEDHAAAERLLASAKDRAEHLMIVDLERNDLGRICEYGSVRVDPLMAVESYTGLHHMVSTVRGSLRRGLGPAEALAAVFPGGSVTGAPKVRAMQIIHELEPVPRGFYCGAAGWISPEGDARFNLAIRTMTWAEGALALHAGGGIVIDSDPEAEWAESRLKAEAMMRAALGAEREASPR